MIGGTIDGPRRPHLETSAGRAHQQSNFHYYPGALGEAADVKYILGQSRHPAWRRLLGIPSAPGAAMRFLRRVGVADAAIRSRCARLGVASNA